MIAPETLGSAEFRQAHGVSYAYVAGSMVRGIASSQIVIAMARAGFLAFFGTGALTLDKIEAAIREIKAALPNGEPWGMNLLSNAGTPEAEMATVDLFIENGVRRVEASAYMQLSPALVRYRASGLFRGEDGIVRSRTLILAKLSRPEVAALFLSPAPEPIVKNLLAGGLITADQATLLAEIPMCDDLCVEADSGGHTDMGNLATLLPTIIRLRDDHMDRHDFRIPVRVGAAGGIGTPEAAASAFVLGADFILTGSINQCTVEAGTSDTAKDLLQRINIQDTDYCPSGSLFELGSKTQVLKKGVFFPARATKLYDLWRMHDSLDSIDQKTRTQIQEKYFRRSFDDVWEETKGFYQRSAPAEIAKAENDPKHKMALIFRWYFVHTMRLAAAGGTEQKVDYQIHCGPALGAFNQWVKGTPLEDWRERHVDDIAKRLLAGTARYLDDQMARLSHPALPMRNGHDRDEQVHPYAT